MGGERKSALARQHLVVGELHLLGRPGFERWISGVADVQRHLAAIPIADVGMGRVWPNGAAAQSRRRIEPIDAQGEPGELG